MANYERVLHEVFTNTAVAQQLISAPESWIWSLLNVVISAVPLPNIHLVPAAFVSVISALFALLDPDYLATVKTPEFYGTPKSLLRTEYDYIIVGGGSAGCLLANRLSAAHSVLLIEGGGTTNILNHVPKLNMINYREPSLGLDWLYHSVEQKYAFNGIRDKKAHMGGGKGIGGSSHLNFQFYSRAVDENYDRWEKVYGAKGWNAKEMVHFMKKHEKAFGEPLVNLERHGKDGELAVQIIPLDERRKRVTDAWLTAGAKVTSTNIVEDHNGEEDTGFSYVQTTVNPQGAISHAGYTFIDPIRKERKDTLHILLNTMVEKVLLDSDKVATGVEYLEACESADCDERKHREVRARNEVILSAGSARDPQILMLSGIGPKEELNKHGIPVLVDLPGVGSNLHDHVMTFGSGIAFPRKNVETGKGWNDLELGELYKFFRNRTGLFMSSVGHIGLSFFHSSLSDDPKRPDLEFFALDMSLAAPVNHGALYKFGMSLEDIPSFIQDNESGIAFFVVLERSKSRGKVRLRSQSINDHPILDLQYLSDPDDVQVLVEGLKSLKKSVDALSAIGGSFSIGRAPGCNQEDMSSLSDEYLECHVKSLTVSVWHMAGTCRIGSRNDPTTVVDSQLRVVGVRNLRVIDASIMPEETTGHMVATVYGIAEKGADLILNGEPLKDEL